MWADVPEDVRAVIRNLKPTAVGRSSEVVGSPSNMVPHGPVIDAECAASFREWLAEAPERKRRADEKAASERAAMAARAAKP